MNSIKQEWYVFSSCAVMHEGFTLKMPYIFSRCCLTLKRRKAVIQQVRPCSSSAHSILNSFSSPRLLLGCRLAFFRIRTKVIIAIIPTINVTTIISEAMHWAEGRQLLIQTKPKWSIIHTNIKHSSDALINQNTHNACNAPLVKQGGARRCQSLLNS